MNILLQLTSTFIMKNSVNKCYKTSRLGTNTRTDVQTRLNFIDKYIGFINAVDLMSVGLVDAAERVCGSDRPNNDAWNAIRKNV